ncbi:hypothetical protein VTN00DRAFT_6647 [Thermoascus crustaceus]|uniref:uncharacterized protein n=1 Tax=Thermoascus crustaceus TaxID=5088 RepID=UPI003744A95A
MSLSFYAMQLGTCCSSCQFRKTTRLLTRRSKKKEPARSIGPCIFPHRSTDTGTGRQHSTKTWRSPLQHLSSLTPKDEAFENHKSRLILKMQPAEILGSRCIHIHDGDKETMSKISQNRRVGHIR